ncbi:sugar phosphate isomerase/epimerase [bacterium]|jgi:sugar phosphate isomerase/epimerase|nr:sugar phosphate isomerase/epimerase [bacterium]
MKFTGISDEAGQPIEVQIKAHKELGWDYLEIREVDKENLTLMSDEKFDEVYAKVSEAGMKVSCFAGAVGNWATKISGDFTKDYDEIKRAIPRMKKFNTKYIRVMSWPNDSENPWTYEDWGKEAIRRMKVLAKMAEDAGIILAHENCSGWAAKTKEMLRIYEEVDSPAFKLMYDTGNVVAYQDGDAFDNYMQLKPYIGYVHIKDYKRIDGKSAAVYPGEGEGRVKEVMADLKKTGYDGFVSIEPHMASVVHLRKVGDPEETYNIYINYGKTLISIAKS